MLTLISATPSPYARKNRIAMIEKGIPFILQTEIPWHADTVTPQYNPLEKLPILMSADGSIEPVYESWLIQEYICEKFKGTGPDLMPFGSIDDILKARKIQAMSDGACDAMGLWFFETSRGDGKISDEWLARQQRKVYGTIKAVDAMLKDIGPDKFLVGDELTIADIGAGAMLGSMNMLETKFGILKWKDDYPAARTYWEMLEERESFKSTVPSMFDLTEKVA